MTPLERAQKIVTPEYSNGGWVVARYYGGELEQDYYAEKRAVLSIAQAITEAVKEATT